MTDTRDDAVPIETLLAHRQWLRELARRLVRDPNDADDLEQSVWLQCVRRPPQHERGLRGWLGRALRSRLSDRHRSDVSRSDRERRTAPAKRS